jgi:hypothetical protein
MIWIRSVRQSTANSAGIQQPGETGPGRRHDLVRLGCLLFILTLAWVVAGAATERASLASIELANQDVSFATKDGLLTATFSETTDDAALNAAIPALVAKGVQAVRRSACAALRFAT